MGSLSLVPYLAARIGLSTSPYLASTALPPVGTMRPDPAPRRRRQGASGTQASSGYLWDLDSNTETAGALWYGSMGEQGIAGKMLKDPHVRQSVRYVCDPLGGATWKVTTHGQQPADKEAADFVAFCLFECLDFDHYRESAVVNYMANGFDLHELTDDVRALPAGRFPLHPGGGRGLVPTGLHEIPGCTVDRWYQSESNPNHLGHIDQWVPFNDKEGGHGYREIEADRLVRLTWAQQGAYFPGFAPLRSAYGAWKLKTAFQTIEAILHERCGVPYPTITLGPDPSDDDVDKAESVLAAMRSNPRGAMTLPNGYAFEWSQAGADDATNIREAIIRCNVDIAYNVSASWMTLGINTKSGSFALGASQQGQYHLSTLSHAKFFASGLNKGSDGWSPIERLVRLNYGPDVAIPQLVATNLPTHNWQDVAKIVINAASARAITMDDPTEDRLREILELPARDPATARKAAEPMPFGGDATKPNKDLTAPPVDEAEDEAEDMSDETEEDVSDEQQ